MAQITRLALLDVTNAITIGRIGTGDVTFSRAEYATWRTAHPGATAAQAEAGIQAAIAAKWSSAPVNVFVHVFDLTGPTIAVRLQNTSEPAPTGSWWLPPL